jgi:hypothetical protein
LLIGAAEFPLTDAEALCLEQAIRRRCVDERRLPLDDDARACLQLADVLADDLAAEYSPEPIGLGISHVEGLREHVVAEDAEALTELRDAVERYCEG